MNHFEDREQIALVTWVRLMAPRYPLLDLVFHVPNGGYRDPRTASKFKAMGVRPGVWDLYIPAPMPGLWIEMKSPTGRLTPNQASFRDNLESVGYTFCVARTWVEAAQAIATHIGMEESDIPI